MEDFRKVFERALTAFVIFLLAVMVLLVLVAVALRLVGFPLVWYDEGASVLLAWLTYYGAALAALKRAHIGFPGLVNSLSPRWRVAAVGFGELCVVTFFALLAWFGFQVLRVLGGDTLVSIPVPTQLTQSVIPIGGALFIVAQLLSLPEVLRQARGTGLVDHELAPAQEANA
ncbi:MAG: TRAP transporter small permease subunit [Pseudomonadota bacterium]|nr:TRAP transporter small permease subunit [Pseudomonadota bacterium]